MAIKDSESVQKFCSLAVQQNQVKATDISLAYQIYLGQKVHAFQCQYVLEATQGRLVLQEQSDGSEWSALDMPAPAFQGQWVPFSSDKLALFDASGRYQDVQSRNQPQIEASREGGFVRAGKQAYRLSTLLNPLIPLDTVQRGPYDFHFPAGQDDGVFLVDRAAGSLLMTDLTLNISKARLPLRAAGSRKALCLAYDTDQRRCLVTDHETSDLIVIRPFDKKIERVATSHGTLGNLVLDAKRQQVLVLLADPEQEPAILIFSLADFSHQGTILVPGKRFSSLDDPCDLMGISPDGRYLVVMTYTDEPALCTPVLSRFDLTTRQLVDTQTLNQAEKPIGLAFAAPLPTRSEVPDFEVLIEEKGLMAKPLIVALVRQIEAMRADANRPLLDQDIAAAMTHIQDNFTPAEIQTVAHISQEAAKQMVNERFFEWQGRGDMNAEDKQVFVERLSQLQADEQVTQTNGIFVLNWLKGLAR